MFCIMHRCQIGDMFGGAGEMQTVYVMRWQLWDTKGRSQDTRDESVFRWGRSQTTQALAQPDDELKPHSSARSIKQQREQTY